MYLGFGTDVRRSCTNPAEDLSVYRTINIWGASADWSMQLDGITRRSLGSNTLGWPANPLLGKSLGAYYLKGKIRSLVMFNAKLSTADRVLMETYMAGL